MPHQVVVPGFGLTSLSIARCLAGLDHDVTAIGHRKAAFKSPLLHSRVPSRKIVIPPGTGLVDALVDLAPRFEEPPALLLAEDSHVVEVSEARDRLAGSYRFLLPPADLVATLMDKQRFAALAGARGLTVPETVTVDGPESATALGRTLGYPFVLKPYLLHSAIVRDERELDAYTGTFEAVQWTSVVAQKWIPGDASSLWWCLAFLDERSRCIAHVTGNKVRLWPPESGNSSICRTAENARVTDETVRVLETLGLVGFASLELKHDVRDDTFYILEPTVGRCDQQVAITRPAGVNIPLIGLRHLFGERPAVGEPRDGATLMWEIWDLFASRHPRQACRESHFRHLARADARMLAVPSDPGPLLASIGSLAGESIARAARKLTGGG